MVQQHHHEMLPWRADTCAGLLWLWLKVSASYATSACFLALVDVTFSPSLKSFPALLGIPCNITAQVSQSRQYLSDAAIRYVYRAAEMHHLVTAVQR